MKSDAELYDLLSQCEPSQLTAITVQLGLKQMFLPGEGEPVATRAAAIMRLARTSRKLDALQRLLDETLGALAAGGCILILAANPIDTDGLRLDKEIKVIKERLDEDERGRRYRVEIALAVSATDLSKLLLKHAPRIVHFSGHGSTSGEIVLEGANGAAQPVPGKALAGLFAQLTGTELVVLNACYSAEQARALSKVVAHVVGMSRAIGDEDALSFAGGFYRALAFGKSYATAFSLGRNEIDLAGLPDGAVPHFIEDGEERPAPS